MTDTYKYLFFPSILMVSAQLGQISNRRLSLLKGSRARRDGGAYMHWHFANRQVKDFAVHRRLCVVNGP